MFGTDRRTFLTATAGTLGLQGLFEQLGTVSAAEARLPTGIARFSSEIEPLVRMLEETPRDRVIEKTARMVQDGLSYRQLLAALLLAGVRNVQPRPSVGFKFHAVLVVNSAHLASLNSSPQDRWLPIFWTIDNFKSAQARDVREGNWTLPAVDEQRVPPPHQAEQLLIQSLEDWDESAADAAITGVARHFGADHVFNLLAQFAVRDFRSIGHKAIFLANGFRTLNTIGWDYAEPILRSLVYAILNHVGEPNPATSDLDADRPGRSNRERLNTMPVDWLGGKADDRATVDLLQTLREGSPEEASEQVVQLLSKRIAVQTIWDAIFAASGELLMRQPGIIALHAVTTTNAMHYAFHRAADDKTRQFLLLQSASFLPMFREAARRRGALADRRIDDLQPRRMEQISDRVPQLFTTIGTNRNRAAQDLYSYLTAGGDPQAVIDHARRLIFLKGNDAHDYKFSSAALEDYRQLSSGWRNRFLASTAFQLRSEAEPTRSLVTRIQQAFS